MAKKNDKPEEPQAAEPEAKPDNSKAIALVYEKMTKAPVALVPVSVQSPELFEMVNSAVIDLGATTFTFPRLKVPTGGQTMWVVPGLEERGAKEINVVVAAAKGTEKGWWRSKDVQNTSPDCESHDGVNAWGINALEEKAAAGHHSCLECPWNLFGSDRNGGRGKDCGDTARLLLFEGEQMLPMLLQVTPGTLKSYNAYALKLLGSNIKLQHVVTQLSLTATKDSKGNPYSIVNFKFMGVLSAEQRERMQNVSEVLKGVLRNVPSPTTRKG